MEEEELKAALELLIATQDSRYRRRIGELWPAIDKNFDGNAALAVRALPYMGEALAQQLEARVRAYSVERSMLERENPFGVPITASGWAESGEVLRFAITQYVLHARFPELIDACAIFRGLDYIYGCHPGSDISFVSGVGTVSKEVAYGNNRADFSFIAGASFQGCSSSSRISRRTKRTGPFLGRERICR